jgi:uroporphyrinogen decarboxylase
LNDGRFEGFCEKLIPLLAENMALQSRAGADVVAMLDTCAGELAPDEYRRIVLPMIKATLERFKAKCPEASVLYYSKGTSPKHWETLEGLPIQGIGIDWNHNLADVLKKFGERWAVQGNVDPHWLFLEPAELESRIRKVFSEVKSLDPQYRQGWICGLGHGVLPKTPESNVKLFLKIQKEMFL